MDIRSTISFDIPRPLIETLGITEDTPFVVTFNNGTLIVEPIIEKSNNYDDATLDIEYENNDWYEEGYEEGYEDGHEDGKCEGYRQGYRAGYEDAGHGRAFDNTYPYATCDYLCHTCRFFNAVTETCSVFDNKE